MYILDDFFEKTISVKDEFKITDNKLTPKDILKQFVSIFYNPTRNLEPPQKMKGTEQSSSDELFKMIGAWQSLVREMGQINPSYKEHTEYVVELQNYFTHMLGGLKPESCNKGHHSEYLYRKIR